MEGGLWFTAVKTNINEILNGEYVKEDETGFSCLITPKGKMGLKYELEVQYKIGNEFIGPPVPFLWVTNMTQYEKNAVWQGTLSLMVLRTLLTMGEQHGYGIARRIEQMSGTLKLSQGSIYPALMRLEQQGWITTKWGTSETNRKVKFYSLTRSGEKQLHIEVANWEQASSLVAKILGAKA